MKICLFLLSILSFTTFAHGQTKVVHVFVALCDNESQGIVPVPDKIGDGDNPAANLYWGCGYGVKNFFDRKTDAWEMLSHQKDAGEVVLERCIFRHADSGTILVADAYRGLEIKTATERFFASCAGMGHGNVYVEGECHQLQAPDLVCYVGHDGLMEFTIDEYPTAREPHDRKAIMLACSSSIFFEEGIEASGSHPMLWTRGLMAPEAYTLEAAVTAWAQGKSDSECEKAAEAAYSKYQGITAKASNWLFQTGL